MAKNNTFTVDGVTYKVKTINQEIQLESNKYYHTAFNNALASGYNLRIEIENMLKSRGLLDTSADDKKLEEIRKEIKSLEIELRRGTRNGKRLSKDEGRELALQIKTKRNELSAIGTTLSSYFSESAETYADNERLQYFIYACTVNAETGEPCWKSFEVFKNSSNSALINEAIKTFVSVSAGVDKDYEKNLYENQWLIKMGFMDNQLRLTKNCKLVDSDGRLINEDGRFIDENGGFVDMYGNSIDKEGNLLVEDTWGVLPTTPVALELIDTGKLDANNNSPLST
jgi:hypothetical protein